MIKNICNYITLILFFLFLPSHIFATTVDPYLVTEGFETTVPTNQKVYFYINIAVNYQSGKVVLSRNPDGTGESIVGESIDASVIPGGTTFEYKTQNKSCNGSGTLPMKPLDITHLLHKGLNNVLIRYKTVWCSQQQVSQLYLVHFNDYEPTTEPFLELPWDYRSKNMSFDDAALSMNSYFDHEYPLLSADWFLSEPDYANKNIFKYEGVYSNESYTSHDGYDYGYRSDVHVNEPVLAAAAGSATFHSECSACGNAIFIDHGNGYQSRYYHLQPDGLLTNIINKKIDVNPGQIIGRTGYSGNVSPAGVNGSHIHFMLIQDKNGDGNFNDNIPDGIIDPYGWQGDSTDPWEQFVFTQNGVQHTGTKSTYLWKNRLSNLKKTLPPEGGTYSSNRYTFTFPPNATDKDLIFSIEPISIDENSAELNPIGYVIDATANDGFDNFITQFSKLFTISMKILLTDYSRYKPDSLSMYSSSDGKTWQKEETTVDLNNRNATTQVNHLTKFAFMGEKKDNIAPLTTLFGNNMEIDETATYHEPVNITLVATDEPSTDSLGIENTFIKINDQDWQIYSEPIELSDVSNYIIRYYSVDTDGNAENIHTNSIAINEDQLDQPEIQISFDVNLNQFIIKSINENDSFTENLIQKKDRLLNEYISSNNDHKITLLTYYPENDEKNIVKFKSIQYDNNEPQILEKYKLITFTKENKGIEKYIQVLQKGDEERIRLAYNALKDETVVVLKNNGIITNREILSGYKKLIIFTQIGNLQYTIQ